MRPGPPPRRRETAAAIDGAVAFLSARQQPYGEIAARRYFDVRLQSGGGLDSSPFTTTFCLHALEFVDTAAADRVRQGAIGFLLSEREPPGVWRYWSSRSGLRISPDLDDTCCASFALRHHACGRPDAEAALPAILSARHESGLFKTWLRAPGKRNDIDHVVNANVLLYLGDRPETEAASRALVGRLMSGTEGWASHYYVDTFALHYAVARAYGHGVKSLEPARNAVVEAVQARWELDEGPGRNPLATALALCALAGFDAYDGSATEAALDYLLASQAEDGGFPRAAFYAGPEPPTSHSVYWGSEELTTCLCLEALARFVNARSNRSHAT